MAVYHKETPEHFAIAIKSMLDQTVPTDDFVIVCDGPLTEGLYGVIDSYTQKFPGLFNIVQLEKNSGIGVASNVGLQACKNDLVAKMDADDISVPTRCETLLKKFEENPALTIAGGFIEEFNTESEDAYALRKVPTTNEEIRKFAKHRNPFNNVTVMYRRNVAIKLGGYKDLRRSEDYDLSLRVLNENYYVENVPEVLVRVRVDIEATQRRVSLRTYKDYLSTSWRAYKIGYTSVFDLAFGCIGGLALSLSPAKLQKLLYKTFLRKDIDK